VRCNDLWDRDIDLQVTRTGFQSRHRRCNGSVGQFWVSRPLPQPALVLVVRGCGASDCVVSSSEAGVSSTQLVLSIAWGEAVLISWSAATARLEFLLAALGRDCTLDTRI